VGAAWFNTPVHLYDLTSTPNAKDSTVMDYSPGCNPVFTDATNAATIAWDSANLLRNWSLENAPITNIAIQAYPGAECTLNWVKVRMLCYPPSGMVSRFQIDIVQFTDDRVVPLEAATEFSAAFWQAQVKQFSHSPLEQGYAKYSKYLKVLHRETFIMEPKDSSETGEANHYREVNIFKRLNRSLRYDWEDKDRMNMIGAEGQINLSSNFKTVVEPRKRIFLMVRAQAKLNTTGFAAVDHPSYDLVITKSQTQLGM